MTSIAVFPRINKKTFQEEINMKNKVKIRDKELYSKYLGLFIESNL